MATPPPPVRSGVDGRSSRLSVLSHRLTWWKVRSINNLVFISEKWQNSISFFNFAAPCSSKLKKKTTTTNFSSLLLLRQKCSTGFWGGLPGGCIGREHGNDVVRCKGKHRKWWWVGPGGEIQSSKEHFDIPEWPPDASGCQKPKVWSLRHVQSGG